MYALEFQIKKFELIPRKHAQLMKQINRRVMERHERRLPNHFEESAYAQYGAKPRKSTYVKFKLKAKHIGHNKPNVKSGDLRASVISKVKIRATQFGATLTTRGTLESRMQDWQKRELLNFSDQEIEEERKRQASEYIRGAKSKQFMRQRRKRIK